MELFKFGIAPKNKTIVCGHWHTSYGHSNIAKEGSEWGPDACFDTFFCYNKETNSNIVALDACTAYTHKVNVEVFNNEGKLVTEEVKHR